MSKDRMKLAFDSKRRNPHLYEPGAQVWFSLKKVSLRHPSFRHKLVPRYIGPVNILETVGRSAVKLELPAGLKIHPTVSVSMVKPYYKRPGSEIPPVTLNGLEEWEVEKISDHHVLNFRRKDGLNLCEFKAVWRGSYEDSWHELSDFANSMSLVELYLTSTCKSSERKRVLKVLKPEELMLLSPALRIADT